MSNDCKECVNEKKGCSLIQQMNKDIKSLKHVRFNIINVFAWIILCLAVVIGVCWGTRFFYSPTQITDSKFVIEVSGGQTGLQGELKNATEAALHEAYIRAEKNASEMYEKNFATLLTILTIFGIAWPVIVGLLQFKFNEKELEKISSTEKMAKDASDKANEASDAANEASTKANDASTKADDATTAAIQAADKAKQATTLAVSASFGISWNQAHNYEKEARSFEQNAKNKGQISDWLTAVLYYNFAIRSFLDSCMVDTENVDFYRKMFHKVNELCRDLVILIEKEKIVDDNLKMHYSLLIDLANELPTKYDDNPQIRREILIQQLENITQALTPPSV